MPFLKNGPLLEGCQAGRSMVAIPGDGIGPEVLRATLRVLHALRVPLELELASAGMAVVQQVPNGLPEGTVEAIQRCGVALKGPTETPSSGGHKSVNVTLRKRLELYANVRPVRSFPGVDALHPDVDLVIVRENVEDTYAGIEHMQAPGVAQCLKVITWEGSLAIAQKAFSLAKDWGRKRVTAVHKANIHKLTDGLFLEACRHEAQRHTGIEFEEILVDAACMHLVQRPSSFDVMVMPNLYGDILSDLAAGLVGGLGLAPSANIGDHLAMFEAVHGSAPLLAGRDLANPMALMLSATMMLRHMGFLAQAEAAERAMLLCLGRGIRTADLGGSMGTMAFADAVVDAIRAEGVPFVPPQATAPQGLSGLPVLPPPPDGGPWHTRGLDLFVTSPTLPQVPEQVGPFTLRLISNRGTKVHPGPAPDIRMVPWFRLRYLAEGPVGEADVAALIAQVGQLHPWVHVERLQHGADGLARYAKAQGE